jgi:hypothetical protein
MHRLAATADKSAASRRQTNSRQLNGLPTVARLDPTSEGWSGRRGSNPRPTAWKAVTLPLSYSRLRASTSLCATAGKPAVAPPPLTVRLQQPIIRISQPLSPPSPSGLGATAFAGLPNRDTRAGLPNRDTRAGLPNRGTRAGLPSRSPRKRAKAGGEGRVRTSVARRRQVYSLLRLTALPPPRIQSSILESVSRQQDSLATS